MAKTRPDYDRTAALVDDEETGDYYRPAAPARPRSTRRASADDISPSDYSDSGVRTRARSSRVRAAMLQEADDEYDRVRADRLPSDPEDEAVFLRTRRRVPVRRNMLLATRWGRITLAVLLVLVVAALTTIFLLVRGFFLHDARFRIQGASSIQILGNTEIGRSELLGIIGRDVGSDIFTVPLAARRTSIQQLPWVQNATVMRLLPNQLRVVIVERKPVAFVREGNKIQLVDPSGVILSMSPAIMAAKHYSFPVVAGISPNDPLETRADRMQLYQRFVAELNSTGSPGSPKVSEQLSEVDVSNPEDVRTLIPSAGTDILLHFGDDDFANRYRVYLQHLPLWRQQYPHLAAIDLRYDRQTVLEMSSSAGKDAASTTDARLDAPPTLAAATAVSLRNAAKYRAATKKSAASKHSTRPVTNKRPHTATR